MQNMTRPLHRPIKLGPPCSGVPKNSGVPVKIFLPVTACSCATPGGRCIAVHHQATKVAADDPAANTGAGVASGTKVYCCPPTTSETVSSQQINTIGHCDDFTMHQSGNHVKLRKGALPKNTATSFLNARSRNVKFMGNAMTELLALSVSVAVLGGIWAFIALGPLGGFALVWVGFIGAGCFFAAGGDMKALSKTIVGMIYGAIVAWIALLIIAKVPVPGLGTVWPAIVVGVTVFFLVIVASTDLLSCVPANVYGYAALVGYTLSAGELGLRLRPQTTPIRSSSSSSPPSWAVCSVTSCGAIGWGAESTPGGYCGAKRHLTQWFGVPAERESPGLPAGA